MELCRRFSDAKVWRGPTVTAHSVRPGNRVVYHGVSGFQVRGCSDPRRVLRVDSEYEVEFTRIRCEGHRLKLRGVEGLFPAQGFHASASHGWVEAPELCYR